MIREREKRRTEMGEAYRTLLGSMCGTRLGIGTGKRSCAMAGGWIRFAPCSATSAMITYRLCSVTMRTGLRRTGRCGSSAPMRVLIHGRTSPRPSRTISTSWILWKPRTLSAGRAPANPGRRRHQRGDEFRSAQIEGCHAADRRMVAPGLCGEQPKPQHGAAGPLSFILSSARSRSSGSSMISLMRAIACRRSHVFSLSHGRASAELFPYCLAGAHGSFPARSLIRFD